MSCGQAWTGRLSRHMSATAVKEQGELFGSGAEFAVDPQDWLPVKLLLQELEKELVERRMHLLRRLSTWLNSVAIFKRIEGRKIIAMEGQISHRDLEYHRALLTLLLGLGENLVLELRDHRKVDPEHLGLKFEDVVAMVEGMRMDLHTYHGGMTQRRRETILSDVFGI